MVGMAGMVGDLIGMVRFLKYNVYKIVNIDKMFSLTTASVIHAQLLTIIRQDKVLCAANCARIDSFSSVPR